MLTREGRYEALEVDPRCVRVGPWETTWKASLVRGRRGHGGWGGGGGTTSIGEVSTRRRQAIVAFDLIKGTREGCIHEFIMQYHTYCSACKITC